MSNLSTREQNVAKKKQEKKKRCSPKLEYHPLTESLFHVFFYSLGRAFQIHKPRMENIRQTWKDGRWYKLSSCQHPSTCTLLYLLLLSSVHILLADENVAQWAARMPFASMLPRLAHLAMEGNGPCDAPPRMWDLVECHQTTQVHLPWAAQNHGYRKTQPAFAPSQGYS